MHKSFSNCVAVFHHKETQRHREFSGGAEERPSLSVKVESPLGDSDHSSVVMFVVKLFLELSLRFQADRVCYMKLKKGCLMFRSHFTILVTATFLSLGLAGAQDSEEFDEPLSEKQAKKTVKLAEDALKNAKRAQSRVTPPEWSVRWKTIAII